MAVGELQQALMLPVDAFEAEYGMAKPTEQDNVVFYCQVGRRSDMATRLAQQLGIPARNYAGSWQEWSQAHASSSK